MQNAKCRMSWARCILHSPFSITPIRLLQSVSFSLLPERLPADAEEPRRFGLVAARKAQRAGDVPPFNFVQRRAPRRGTIGLEGGRVENLARQMIQPDRADIVEAGGVEPALDGVPQLAYVARPRVVAQRRRRVACQRRRLARSRRRGPFEKVL